MHLLLCLLLVVSLSVVVSAQGQNLGYMIYHFHTTADCTGSPLWAMAQPVIACYPFGCQNTGNGDGFYLIGSCSPSSDLGLALHNVYHFNETECGGEVAYTVGYSTECVPSGPSGSFAYSCTSEEYTGKSYSDPHCQVLESTFSSPTGCSYFNDSGYIDSSCNL